MKLSLVFPQDKRWLDNKKYDNWSDIHSLLYHLQNEITTASICVYKYTNHAQNFRLETEEHQRFAREYFQRGSDQHSFIEADKAFRDHLNYTGYHSDLQIQFGISKHIYDLTVSRIYADEYISHLVKVYNILNKLRSILPHEDKSTIQPYMKNIQKWHDQIVQFRDSNEHIDERAMGQSNGKPIALKPIMDSSIIKADGQPSGMALNNFGGDSYETTSGRGDYIKIEINYDLLKTYITNIQPIIDSLKWVKYNPVLPHSNRP